MRTHLIAGSTLALLALSLPALAGPLDPAIIPKDAAVVAHLDLDAVRGSYTYSVMEKKLGTEIGDAWSEFEKEAAPFDVNLIRNARSVTFWAEVNGNDDGAIIIDGVNARKVIASLKKVPGHKMKKRRGLEVHTFDGEGALVAIGSRLVMAENEVNVRRTIATIKGKKPSLKRNRTMPALGASNGALLVVAMDDNATQAVQKQSSSAMLKNGSMRGALMEINEQGRDLITRVTIDTSAPKVAQKLAEIGNGGIALLSLTADEPELSKLLSALTITTKGASVSAELTADSGDIIDMIKNNM